MPYNTIKTTDQLTYCIDSKRVGNTKLKVTTERRYCHPHKIIAHGSHIDSIPCEVLNKVIRCETCKYFEVYQANDHSVDCNDFMEINPNTFHPEAQLYGIQC